MDTRRMLNNKYPKDKLKQSQLNEIDSDSEEDNIIFNNQKLNEAKGGTQKMGLSSQAFS